MKRYTPEDVDGTLFLVDDEGVRLEIGTVDDVVAAVGGETYTIEYDDKQRTQPWVQTDGVLEIDIRETATTLPHTEETVGELVKFDMETGRYGLPTRTVEFADRLVEIFERQGNSRDI